MRPSPLAALACAAPLLSASAHDDAYVLRCGTGVHGGEAHGVVALPQGELFCPLIADPKGVRSFATFLHGEFPTSAAAIDLASVGIGDALPLLRAGGPHAGEGLQLGLEAAVFATREMYLRKDAPFGLSGAWSQEGEVVRVSGDPLAGVQHLLAPYKYGYGIA